MAEKGIMKWYMLVIDKISYETKHNFWLFYVGFLEGSEQRANFYFSELFERHPHFSNFGRYDCRFVSENNEYIKNNVSEKTYIYDWEKLKNSYEDLRAKEI